MTSPSVKTIGENSFGGTSFSGTAWQASGLTPNRRAITHVTKAFM